MNPLLAVSLAPLGGVYGLGMLVREELYRSGFLHSHSAPVPVICVGNLSLGGTGKSPATEYVVRALQRLGAAPGIVSRGYGRRTPRGHLVMVSNGRKLLADAAAGGDEPVMMARALPHTPVFVCADRLAACHAAALLCNCIVLDDGFQHLRLRREADLVLVDAGVDLSRMRVFPAGSLREPISGIRRAAAVIHTRAPGEDGAETAASFHAKNRSTVSRLAPDIPQFDARFQANELRPATDYASTLPQPGPLPHSHRQGSPGEPGGERMPVEALAGRRVVAFAGIARPGQFFESLRRLGAEVAPHPLHDHATPSPAFLDRLRREARDTGALLVTTAKDAVKLRPEEAAGPPPAHVLVQTVRLDRPADLDAILQRATGLDAASRKP